MGEIVVFKQMIDSIVDKKVISIKLDMNIWSI